MLMFLKINSDARQYFVILFSLTHPCILPVFSILFSCFCVCLDPIEFGYEWQSLVASKLPSELPLAFTWVPY